MTLTSYWTSSQRLGIMAAIALRGWALTMAASILLCSPQVAWSQRIDPVVREAFLADPLTAQPRDPLLPVLPVQRPLSPLEKRALGEALDRLNAEALAEYEAGEVDAAFAMWMRELQLRRAIDQAAELAAIQRVATLAWQANRAEESQIITFRLQQIEADLEADGPIALDDLDTLGTIYHTLRDQPAALAVYHQIAEIHAERGDRGAQIEAVEQIAQLHLDWFHHSDAALTYATLLTLTGNQASLDQQVEYLTQLIYSHEQAQQFEPAIVAQGRLLTLYQTQGITDPLPLLTLNIARNYLALDRPDLAQPYYQSAYANAQILSQQDNASQTLADLAGIYRQLGNFQQSLELYGILIEVGRKSDNLYAIMNAFDQIGQIYRDLDEIAAARLAFERGLTVAQRLEHQEAYFEAQLSSLSRASPDPPPAAGQSPWQSGENSIPSEQIFEINDLDF
ncbi:MAG: tetratricopeptide repeat protein [Cyanobacteria bacterium P01_A01_bin.123]